MKSFFQARNKKYKWEIIFNLKAKFYDILLFDKS